MIGFPAGGGPDILARQIAAVVSKRTQSTWIIENRVGAIGTIGASAVARSAPDGYTLLFGVAANLVIGPAILKNVRYDPVKSFSPIVEVARGPYVLLVSASLPVHSVDELVDYANRNPGKLNFGSVGPGSPHHYAGELFKRVTGADIVHIPYKGGSQAYVGFLAGQVQMMFDSMPGPEGAMQAGTVRALAVTGDRRLKTLPDVPTLAEAGLKGVDVHFMFGVMAPAGTPRDIVDKLNAAFADALADPEVRAAFARQSVDPSPGTPEAFGALVASEYNRWIEIAAQTGFRPE